jgi:iron complex outermembrane receptor protein
MVTQRRLTQAMHRRRSGDWPLLVAALGAAAAAPAWAADPAAVAQAGADQPAAAAQPPASASVAPAPAAAQGVAVQEVIVTAQKRAQNLQDVPISVQVVSGATITQQNFRTLQDLSQDEPGLTITPVGRGVRLALRGVSSGTNTSFNQSVVTFVDDIYHGQSRQSGSALFDIDSVELLKGPQTAFFGNNAIAGAINIQTAKPTHDFEGSLRTLYGSNAEYAEEAVVNVPVTDKLAVRIAGLADGMNGYLDDKTGGGYLPHERNLAIRGSALWQPINAFKLLLKVEATTNRNKGGAGFQIVNCPPKPPFTTPGLFCPQIIASGSDTQLNNVRDQNAGQAINLSTQDYEATASYNLGPATLTSVTDYNHFDFVNLQDLDGSPLPLFGLRAPQAFGQASQEIRLASNDVNRPLSYIFGGYYQHSDLDDVSELTYSFLTPSISAAAPFAPLAGHLPLGQSDDNRQHEDTLSGFASVTWRPIDKLSLTAGVRATRVHRSIDQIVLYGQSANEYGNITPYPANLAALAQAFATAGGLGASGQIRLGRADSDVTPTFNAQYAFTRRISAYASYTEGFKAGGFNGSLTTGVPSELPFSPEHVKAYEAGVRTELFDRRLQLNGTVFRSDYNDLQVSIYAVNNGAPVSLVQNAASSVSQGVELESKVAATNWLSFGASTTFLDAHYQNFPGAASTSTQKFLTGALTQNLSGRPLAYAPKFAGDFYAIFRHSLTDRFNLEVEADVLHQSSYFTADQDDPNLAQGAYTKLDMRASLYTANSHWEFSIIGKNLTDATIVTSAIDSAAAGSYFFAKERPINVEGQIRYKW